MSESTKQVVTFAEFNKKVEIEAQNLMYFDRMSPEKALEKAKNYVGSKFQAS
jgi:hypothetical protein